MILVKDSNVCVRGTKIQLMAELTSLISGLVDNGDDFDWEDIDVIVKTAKMSPEELQAATDKMQKELKDNPFGMWLLTQFIMGNPD